MKKALLAFGALTLTGSAFAQGTLTYFNNNLTPASGAPYRAGIFRDNGDLVVGNGTVGAGAGYIVGLFKGTDLTAAPLATSLFRTTSAQEVFATTADVAIPGIAPGSTAQVTVAAWDSSAATYGAVAIGKQRGSQTFTTRGLGGPNPDPTQPAIFTPDMGPGFTGFEMQTVVPEPTTIALGAIGIGALLLRRRK